MIRPERSHLLGGVEEKGTAIVGVLLLPQQLHPVEKGALIFVQRVEELKQRLDGLGTESMEGFQDIEVGWLPGDVVYPARGHVPGSEVACRVHCDRPSHLKDVLVFRYPGARRAAIAGRAIAAPPGRTGGRGARSGRGAATRDRSLYGPVVAPELVGFDLFPFLLAHAVFESEQVLVDAELQGRDAGEVDDELAPV